MIAPWVALAALVTLGHGLDGELDTVSTPPPDASVDEAAEHFTRGVQLYAEGDFKSALFEFQESHKLIGDYRILYNIGVTEHQLRDYAAALQSLERYLDAGGSNLAPERRDEVTNHVRTLRTRVGYVALTTNVEGASIQVDDAIVGTSPLATPLTLNIGPRRLEIHASGYQPHAQPISISANDTMPLHVELSPWSRAATDRAPTDGLEPTSDGSGDGRPRHPRAVPITAWVFLGGTVLAGAATIVTGTLALDADDDLRRELEVQPPDPTVVDDAQSRRSTLAVTTDALIGVTAAMAATTLTLGVVAIVRRTRRGSRDRQAMAPHFVGPALRF